MYRKFHKLRVRFAECELTQAEAARRAGIPPDSANDGQAAFYRAGYFRPVQGSGHPYKRNWLVFF